MQDNHESTPLHDSEIWVTEFTQQSALDFRKQVLAEHRKSPDTPIIIRINSYGGYVDSLAAMISTMQDVPNRFITVVQGCAMSCGAILLSQGDMRFCDPLARVMIHNVSAGSWGDAYTLKTNSDETMRMNECFMGLLANNCGMTYEALQKKIKDSTNSLEIWMNAEDALKMKIVDAIGLPDLAPMIQWGCETRPAKERIILEKEETPVKKSATPKRPAKKKR